MTGVPQLSTTEKRFRDAQGQQYLRDGVTIRCHAVSKGNLRKARIEQGDLDLTSDDIWPEGQCQRAAEPGSFACALHGGKSALAAGRSVSIGILPYDLQQKIEILQQNPDYISREAEIWQLLGLNAQLYERLEELSTGPETLYRILDGLAMIENGTIGDGVKHIRRIIQSELAQRETRDEIRINTNLLAQLTKVQVSTAKELKTMATTDQVLAMVEGIVDDFISIVKDVIGDKTLADRLIDRFVRAVKLRLNARIAVPGGNGDG